MPSFADVVLETRAILPQDYFTYAVPSDFDDLAVVGQRVEIPFGAKTAMGYVVARHNTAVNADVRNISAVFDEPPLLSSIHLELARWVAHRYCAPLGEVIKAAIPARIRARPTTRRSSVRRASRILEDREGAPLEIPPELTSTQSAVLQPILDTIRHGDHARYLLHGVTGSGKTEIYLRAIAAAIAEKRQAIVLVPEIALTPQTVARFGARFGTRVTVVHSALTDAERAKEWRRIRNGDVDVVVGSRSAVFAPLDTLGIIVVDEEDSPSYKQDRIPRYHAVDTALELGRLCNAPVVLGSATPRVETFYGAHTGGFQLISMPERINQRPLPPIEVVDLREELASGNRGALSSVLTDAVRDCFEQGGQSILFLNRRGSATVVLCRTCGTAVTCNSCSVSLVYHHTRRRCDCHYCGASKPLPSVCDACGSRAINQLGTGTERLEAEIAEAFPAIRLLRMDRDTTRTRDSYFDIYEKFRAGEADCLIGTQMVAKGWDLGNVRLVGIVNADTSLHFPDYRAGELTFSLLTQVAGRAGRADETSRVVLQTYSPDHYAVRHAMTHDYLGFAREEVRYRKALRFPPYSRLVTCTMSHADDDKARVEATRVVDGLVAELALRPATDRPEVMGPSAAFVHQVRGIYRWQFTVRGSELDSVADLLPRGRGWSIDVDPTP